MERFEKIYSQGIVEATQILVDRETGIHYIFHYNGQAGGLTVLLGPDGKPVTSKSPK